MSVGGSAVALAMITIVACGSRRAFPCVSLRLGFAALATSDICVNDVGCVIIE